MIKEIIGIYWERAKMRKALRLLNKQTWSVEFLTKLLVKAANVSKQKLEMEIISRDGTRLVVRTQDLDINSNNGSFDIFDHLDDDIKLREFEKLLRGK